MGKERARWGKKENCRFLEEKNPQKNNLIFLRKY
jgi:hypothetical protein